MKASGDIRTLPTTLFLLVKKNWSSEIRLHAFKMLQVQVHMLLLHPFVGDLSCLFDHTYFPRVLRENISLFTAFGAIKVGGIKPERAQKLCETLH
jgi:hypothetical protein